MQTQRSNLGSLTAAYTVEAFDRGPEPDWHKDRRLFAPWQPVALVAHDTDGNTIAEVLGFDDRDAWFRLAAEVH
jgi:hypothetical protein